MQRMLTWMKLITLLSLIGSGIACRETGVFFMCAAATILVVATGTGFREWLKRNILIAIFTAMFCGLAIVSGIIRDDINYRAIALDAMRILLIYNLVSSGMRWIGREGGYRIIAAMPSVRVRMFFILFGRVFNSIAWSHRSVLDHIRCRVDFRWRNRLLIVRYYTQNIMEKEMYAYRHHQAALMTRLSSEPVLIIEGEERSLAQVMLTLFIAILCAAMICMRIEGISL